MNTEEYRKEIEKKILIIIEERLKNHQMNADRAREIARYILNSLHPHMSLNQIYETVQKFDDHFPELISVVIEVSKEYEERIKKVVVDQVRLLLRRGKIDEANILLEKAINNEVKLKE